MSIKATNIISYIFAFFSILLVIFGCFAPIIFTQSNGLVDFSETGQIGDTIGGTMSPIVAIAGVFMTFIAFLMQVNANRIQSNQLRKSLSLKLLENRIDSRNALQLMSVDLTIMIKNIKAISDEIEHFCKLTEENPTGEIPFHFTPKMSNSRYTSINRNLVYNAFASFMDPNEYLEDFRATYTLMDFYSEGLDILYSNIYRPYIEDIMTYKKMIPSAFENFCNVLKDYASNGGNKKLIHLFFQNSDDRLINEGILNIFELHKTLDDRKFFSLYDANRDQYQKLLSLTNSVITQNKMMIAAFRDARNNFLAEDRYNRLVKIRDIIDNVLSKNTIETIQAEFEKKE